jgi:hypothetical protein
MCVLFAALGAAGCSSSSADRATDTAADLEALRRQTVCPADVRVIESVNAPIAEVLRAAERLLAARTAYSQGHVYRLTPRLAPIRHVQRLSMTNSEIDQRAPGKLRVNGLAAALCGEATAKASWAIQYDLIAAGIAGTQDYPFLVKTASGWRFWGSWCGAGRTSAWRAANCS